MSITSNSRIGSAQPFNPASFAGIAGKVVMNTGAANGIGLHMAHGFARHGARLVLVDIDASALEAARAELAQAWPGVEIETCEASITDPEAMERACVKAEGRFGGIDILLNNAGISMNKPALELTPSDWRRAIDIDLSGVFFAAQAAGRRMVRQRSGVIISTASMWGLASSSRRVAYCAAKAGVVSLTKSLAAEWAEYNVRVNAVCPGYTRTALVDSLIARNALDQDALMQRTPLGRLGTPQEMAEVALFLASDSAAFITGHALVSDGGWTADGF
ncbi:SDR family NAD(P)-dependent oxidoreductase [Caballeronia insecticola]|uniref:Short-chain dehydrogenase/reductase SDR n=1 Tax=Caballeronia insecticola TaxID=758793 RepID=R4WUA7_9BURK|nr:SDR family NAD(P)-dependent oxidoreductase [Caballeronia insecticola]BAN28173.1 short-chain dehydrogenase/reductase SDR [Caballeronia insecticola]